MKRNPDSPRYLWIHVTGVSLWGYITWTTFAEALSINHSAYWIQAMLSLIILLGIMAYILLDIGEYLVEAMDDRPLNDQNTQH